MYYSDDRYGLRVEFQAKDCQLPADELIRMQQSLAPLGEAVGRFGRSELLVRVLHHPHADQYHIEARLRLPAESLFTGDWDPYLDSAYQRCVRKLIQKVHGYRDLPGRRALQTARRESALDHDIVAPEGRDPGPLSRVVAAGDYKRFREAVSGYEEWLRKRVGRWLQRYPKAEARIGRDLLIGDLVEEVFLNAFERYPHRPQEVPFHQWLDNLLDPSLLALLQHPDRGHENASFARTLRETPLGRT
jgi:hypothetical protein